MNAGSTTRRALLSGLLLTATLLGACSGDDDDDAKDDKSSDDTTTTTAAVEPLRIMVTNDDGVEGEGIAALVKGLDSLDDVEVTVVAPATDQSGQGGKTSPTPHQANDATLKGGAPAIAVDGFPADSVVHGLDEVLDEPPHLVVSGINAGQNLGPIAEAVSGTVGAAKMAASRGVPALAVSQGLGAGDSFDYATGVELTLAWIEEHRAALLAGDVETDTVANLNVPSCATGKVRGVVEVPTAADAAGRDMVSNASECTSTATNPKDDIDAFLQGYAPLAEVPAV